VQATRNVIEFALYGRVKKLAYISTDGIFPDGLKDCREDVDIEQYYKALEDASGYSQSKWV
jgi:thioester reductase-like protein